MPRWREIQANIALKRACTKAVWKKETWYGVCVLSGFTTRASMQQRHKIILVMPRLTLLVSECGL